MQGVSSIVIENAAPEELAKCQTKLLSGGGLKEIDFSQAAQSLYTANFLTEQSCDEGMDALWSLELTAKFKKKYNTASYLTQPMNPSALFMTYQQ